MMKRFLLCLTAISALTAQAADWRSATPLTAPSPAKTLRAPQRAADTDTSSKMEVGYCGEPYSALSAGKGTRAGGAIWFNTSMVKKFAGNRVTAIMVANGSSQAPGITSTNIELFCSTSLEGTPAISMTSTMDYTKAGQYTTYTLPEPMPIEEGKPFYVGYLATAMSDKDYPLMVDYLAHDIINEPAGFIGLAESATSPAQWDTQTAQQYGYACLKAVVEGDNLPADAVDLTILDMPYSVCPGEPFTLTAVVTNVASNIISDITMDITVASGQTFTATSTLSSPIRYGEQAEAEFTATCAEEGNNLKTTACVTAVNGNANQSGVNTGDITFLSIAADHSFARCMVVEEGTGNWCGWCPRGIVALEKMRELHTDGTFIPIAVHGNYSMTQRDPMTASSYSSLLNRLSGFPSSLVNRNMDYYGQVNPDFDMYQAIYKHIASMPAMARVEIDTVITGTRIDTISCAVTFGIPADSKTYRLAYVVMEDSVGPYNQSNYFSSTQEGHQQLDGWTELGKTVPTIYNDVARAINSYAGLSGSIPASVAAGETVTHRGTVSMSAVKNRAHARYVALLINTVTGCIENAALYSPADHKPSSLPTVDADWLTQPVRYFDLQGRELARPVRGQVVIRRQGSRADKILY